MEIHFNIASPEVGPLSAQSSDPVRQLGVLCGMDQMAMTAEGYCSLMLNHHQVVHMARRPGSSRILLSVSLSGRAETGPLGRAKVAQASHAICAVGIRIKVLSDATLCAQFAFEGQGASGQDLLAAVDDLLAHVDDWEDAVKAIPLPFSQVSGSGFSYAVKRRSRCV